MAKSCQWTTSAANGHIFLVMPTTPSVCSSARKGCCLKRHGYKCSAGILYFAGSKERVRVPFDEELRTLTIDSLRGLRNLADSGQIPAPLEDSPKCPRCSLVGICLPDETNWLRTTAAEVRSP